MERNLGERRRGGRTYTRCKCGTKARNGITEGRSVKIGNDITWRRQRDMTKGRRRDGRACLACKCKAWNTKKNYPARGRGHGVGDMTEGLMYGYQEVERCKKCKTGRKCV